LLAVNCIAPIAWKNGRPIGRRAFLVDTATLAARLPDSTATLNLCEDRYAFLVAFAAIAIRGQSNLLPASRLDTVVAETAERYPGSHRLNDADVEAALCTPLSGEVDAGEIPLIATDHVIAIAFTSGSTGQTQPHPKRWCELVAGAELAFRRFSFALSPGSTVVATVPPQHMYGLETSILLPLTADVALFAGRPFFPADIANALSQVPTPRILVTTPAHLRVAVAASIHWPEVAAVISATAPLTRRLAAAAELAFAAPVMEIYGFTEAGSIASRRTTTDDAWTFYDTFRLAGASLTAPHLPLPIPVNDVIEPEADGRFRLLGRPQDLVNIAGKRTSLAHLNAVLGEIEGVVDGVFVVPEEEGERPERLAALVVAPGIDRRQILSALAQRIDRLFLPRPLINIDRLPRSDTGKVPREALRKLLEAHRKANGDAGTNHH
jgi:acyl-coenzyme A synthetase/AMP-(fatty) acid ligase